MNDRIKELATKGTTMTREEILQIGRKAGALIETAQEKDLLWLERFTEMVAAKEREACAKLFEDRDNGIGYYEPHEPAKLIKQYFGIEP